MDREREARGRFLAAKDAKSAKGVGKVEKGIGKKVLKGREGRGSEGDFGGEGGR